MFDILIFYMDIFKIVPIIYLDRQHLNELMGFFTKLDWKFLRQPIFLFAALLSWKLNFGQLNVPSHGRLGAHTSLQSTSPWESCGLFAVIGTDVITFISTIQGGFHQNLELNDLSYKCMLYESVECFRLRWIWMDYKLRFHLIHLQE